MQYTFLIFFLNLSVGGKHISISDFLKATYCVVCKCIVVYKLIITYS